MKKVLITGANGNLGRLVGDRFISTGVEVTGFDLPDSSGTAADDLITGDIRDTALLESIIKQHRPDGICHLASLLSGSSELDLEASWDINATSSLRLMQLAREYNVERFFFASSAATYSGVDANPMPNDYPQWPLTLYGVTKLAVERLGYYFQQKHGLDFHPPPDAHDPATEVLIHKHL